MDDLSHHTVEPDRLDGAPYLAGSRGAAVGAMVRAVRDRDILLLLTGPAGVGKSTVLNAALASLGDEPIQVIRLRNPGKPAWGQIDLAQQLLGRTLEASGDPSITVAMLELPEPAVDEARTVIAVDDAHTLTDDAMELLLLMASPARGAGITPQLIFSGRGDFWERPWREELRLIAGLAERVTLEPFAATEAKDYIAFGLRRNGASIDDIIAPEALRAICRYAGGLPGRIDRIIAAATLIGAFRRSQVVTVDIVRAAIASLEAKPAGTTNQIVVATPHAMSPPFRSADLAPTRPGWARPGWALRGAALAAIFLALAGVLTALLPGPRATVARAFGWIEPHATNQFATASPAGAGTTAMPTGAGTAAMPTGAGTAAMPAPVAVAPATDDARAEPTPRGNPQAGSTPGTATPAPEVARAQPATPGSPRADPSAAAGIATPALGAPENTGAAMTRDASAVPGPVTPATGHAPQGEATTASNSAAPPDAATGTATFKVVPLAAPLTEREATEATAVPAGSPAAPPASDDARPLSNTDLVRLEQEARDALTLGHMDDAREKMTELKRQVELIRRNREAQAPEGGTGGAGAARSPASGGTERGAGRVESQAADPAPANQTTTNQTTANQTTTNQTTANDVAKPVVVATAMPATAPDRPSDAANSGTQGAARSAAASPTEPATGSRPPSEIVSTLLRRGDELLRQGDVLSARLFYERAAAAGSGPGAIKAGKTYDPNFLATIDAPGLTADAARALRWYRTASTVLGDRDADALAAALTAHSSQ